MKTPLETPLIGISLSLLALGALAPEAPAQRTSLSGGGSFNQAGNRSRPGGGLVTVPDGLNGGGLNVDDFDHIPDQPGHFQPFVKDETLLTLRKELAVVVPNSSLSPSTEWIQEDPGSGYSEVLGSRSLFGATANIRSIASGQLDADPAEELVAIEILFGGSSMRVIGADRAADGTYTLTELFTVDQTSFTFKDAHIELGNVDDDDLDEILLVGRSKRFHESGTVSARLRVYDDSQAGSALLFSYLRNQNHADMRGYAADIDGDGRGEVIVELQGDTTAYDRMAVRTFDDAVGSFALLRGWQYLAWDRGKVSVGDFDGDGMDELGVLDVNIGSGNRLSVALYGFDGTSWVLMGARPEFTNVRVFNREFWDITTVDRNADGRDELAVMVQGATGYRVFCNEWFPATGQWDTNPPWINVGPNNAALTCSIAAGDTDADGYQDLYLSVANSNPGLEKTVQVGHIDYDFDGTSYSSGVHWEPVQPLGIAGDKVEPVLAAGDFDADGFHVRYSRKFLVVADPIPLVLLTAAPTQQGIDQNFDNTSTSYFTSSSSSDSIGVTNAMTASVSVGYEVEDLTGLFGASVKATVEAAFEESEIETSRTTLVQGFGGAYDTDVLIFQATLYRSYEYEIVAAPDPDLVGTYFTIDRPVDTNIYKWTVDFFNDRVTPENMLPADLFPHTIGDPSSYRNRLEHTAFVADLVSWSTDESTIGQGNGVNTIAIEFETENTTEQQRTLGAGIEAEFKAGGASVGGSFGISQTNSYSISVSEATVYEGVLGDIGDTDDYDDYSYNFGLTVHQNGMNADADNLPTSLDPGVKPFLVVSYWTHLTGAEF